MEVFCATGNKRNRRLEIVVARVALFKNADSINYQKFDIVLLKTTMPHRAELKAILLALEVAADRHDLFDVKIHSHSAYAINILKRCM